MNWRLLYSAHAGNFLFTVPFHLAKITSALNDSCFSRVAKNSLSRASHSSRYFPVRTLSRTKLSMISTQRPRPSSFAIRSRKALVLSLMESSEQTCLIAAPSSPDFSTPSLEVPTPQPPLVSAAALSSWSAKTGVMIVGEPELSEACNVPTPPWCTQQQHCGNSHSCGAVFMKMIFCLAYPRSSSSFGSPSRSLCCSPAQPLTMTPRCPAIFSASTASRVMCWLV
mmetsp:Transcript_61344/g.142751  ORF Transcript_61344/g.142751 Transcript_61344/m.142751 type:complete len:225 (+) Transcript_61344:431-1105(+)